MKAMNKREKQKWDKHSLKFWIKRAAIAKQEIEYYSEKRDYKKLRKTEEYLIYCKDSIETYIQRISYLEGSFSSEKKMKDRLMKKVKKVLGE